MSAITPGPWRVEEACGSNGQVCFVTIVQHGVPLYRGSVATVTDAEHMGGITVAERNANACLIAAAPDLLTLAHQYASECGDCAGTRVCPDDEPCTACADVWRVIDKAEGRT